jgi:hypothetical protein
LDFTPGGMKLPLGNVLKLATSAALSLTFGGFAEARSTGEAFGEGSWSWSARNLIVGQTSTAMLSAGGSPLYSAPMPQYSGVASLLLTYEKGLFQCTGSLLPDRLSVLSAAHCFNPSEQKGALLGTTAFFYAGSDPDTVVASSPASTEIPISHLFIHPQYTGAVIDHHDVAVLRLAAEAPSFASSYGLGPSNSLTGSDFNVAGYGARSSTGGSIGANLGVGVLRQGGNSMDFRFGDPDFNGSWQVALNQPLSVTGFAYLADFDNGLVPQDSSCRVAEAFGLNGPKYCDLGRGQREASVAGGDSGGPQFDADFNIISVTSFGITFGPNFGDIDGTGENRLLNSSWGEFGGYVPVYYNRSFIETSMVQVPGPLPIAGLPVVIGLSRQLRRRLHSSR